MPGEVQVLVYGAELVAQEIVNVGERAVDLTTFWGGIEAKIEAIEEEQFSSYGSRGPSGAWPENTNEWNWRKFQAGHSLELMKATEAMFEALTGPGEASVRVKTPTELHFGANLEQFDVWQGGYDGQGSGNRYPIDLTPEDEREIAADILAYIVGSAGTGPGYTLDSKGRKRIPKGMPGAGRFTR